MISHWEVCVHDRWQIRNNLQLPEGCGQVQGAAYRANRLSPTGPTVPTDQKSPFGKQEQEQNRAKSETNYSWRSTNLDIYASPEG
jgi:hypothetical protein